MAGSTTPRPPPLMRAWNAAPAIAAAAVLLCACLIGPPAAAQDAFMTFQQQLQSGQVKVLVYNGQTVTPLTQNIKKLAADQNIPIVGVTETIQPPDTSFQDCR